MIRRLLTAYRAEHGTRSLIAEAMVVPVAVVVWVVAMVVLS